MTAFRLGFACSWWTPRASTWSHTPSNLQAALARQPVELVPIDAQRPLVGKVLLRALYAPTRTPWKYSRVNRALTARAIRRRAMRARCEAVLSTADDDMPGRVPTFVYQDMNYSVALGLSGLAGDFVSVIPTTREVLERLDREQRRNYDDLEGIFVFGRWFGEWLVGRQNVRRERVHVVGGGLNFVPDVATPPARHGRLLFAGVDFHRKGGDQVVDAVGLLRSRGHDVTLTVVGPGRWPLPDPPPPWVRFAGYAEGRALTDLWSTHDLLVVPSHFEAYGIVFSEAIAAGRPAIGRRAFAMPELIGDCGRLVEPDAGPEELAAEIASVLSDDALYDRAWRARHRVREERSWDAVARRMLSVIGPSLSRQ